MGTKALPRTLQEAVRYYSDLDVCRGYVASLRWPDGITCPTCDSPDIGWLETRTLWKCRACKKQFSVKQGTVFEDSALGLDKWLVALWAIMSMKNGISSYELSRTIGVSQKSCWHMLHRLRLAMKARTFTKKLAGHVEADESFFGGLEQNRHANKRMKVSGSQGKTAVLGMLQRRGDVRAAVIASVDKATLQTHLHRNVEEGSNLYTDGSTMYRGMDVEYQHAFVDHITEYVRGNVHSNGIENFWSLLKRTIKGTYIHVSPEHLQAYVDE